MSVASRLGELGSFCMAILWPTGIKEDALICTTPLIFSRIDSMELFGEEGVAETSDSSLPQSVLDALDEDCPFWPDRKVRDTHIAFFMPSSNKDRFACFNRLKERLGSERVFINDENVSEEPNAPYWVLLTKQIAPDTRGTPFKELFDNLPNYEIPTITEVLTSIYLANTKDKKLFRDEGLGTFCIDHLEAKAIPVILANMEASQGPEVALTHLGFDQNAGSAAVRRIPAPADIPI